MYVWTHKILATGNVKRWKYQFFTHNYFILQLICLPLLTVLTEHCQTGSFQCGLRIFSWVVTMNRRVKYSTPILQQPTTLAGGGGTIFWNKISKPGNQCVTIQKTWILTTKVQLLYSKSLPVYPLKWCAFPQVISLNWIWKLPSVIKYKCFPTHDQVPF